MPCRRDPRLFCAALVAWVTWCAYSASFVGQWLSVSHNECAFRGFAQGLTRLKAAEAGQELRGTVTGFNKCGANLDVGLDVPAFLHVSKIQKDYLKSAEDVLTVGQEIHVTVEVQRRGEIVVTMLPRREDIAIGQKLTGTVTGWNKSGALLDVGLEVQAFLPIAKIQEERLNSIEDVLSKGQEVEVRVEMSGGDQIWVTMLPSNP